MSKTRVTGVQVADGSIQRVDLDVTTTGQALITKVLAGDNISLNSTGVDSGTGDVTINVTGLASVATSGSYNDLTDKPNASASALDDLTDVTVTSPTNGQVLQYNGSAWVNGAAPSTFSGSYNDLTEKPDLSVYALETDLTILENRVDTLEGHALVTKEVPVGNIDGVNAVFTLATSPVAGSEQVFLNGLLQEPGETKDYTISGSTVTFTSAPEAGWKVLVNYLTGSSSYGFGGGSGSSGAIEIFQDEEFTWPGSGNTFRTITHNKGRHPDIIKVFHKLENSWTEVPDYMEAYGPTYGYIEFDNANVNQVTLRLDNNPLSATARQVRIRLYWFGAQDVGTASAGAFSVGGSSGVSPFQWSNTEQVYPFEKASDGSALYCKEINVGNLTNGSSKSVSHGISNFHGSKLHSITGTVYRDLPGGESHTIMLNCPGFGGVGVNVYGSAISVDTPGADFSMYTCVARIIYRK